MKITRLEIENVKRIVAARICPRTSELVTISGRNAQGKSSVLDSITYALAGMRNVPGEPVHHGAEKGEIRLELTPSERFPSGLIVERTIDADRSSKLRVKDGDGTRVTSPQAILDDMLERGATFDPTRFERQSAKEQGSVLARIAGFQDPEEWEAMRQRVYLRRRDKNREVERLKKHLDSLEVPLEPEQLRDAKSLSSAFVDASIVCDDHRDVASALDSLEAFQRRTEESARRIHEELVQAEERVRILRERLELERSELRAIPGRREELLVRQEKLPALPDLEKIRADLDDVEAFNRRQAKLELELAQWNKAAKDLEEAEAEAKEVDDELSEIDAERKRELESASWPLPGMSYDAERGVLYNGLPLNQASQSERIRIGVAVGLSLNPEVRVLLVREGSLLDRESLGELARLAEENDAQAWVEMVGKQPGAIVIEDGEVEG